MWQLIIFFNYNKIWIYTFVFSPPPPKKEEKRKIKGKRKNGEWNYDYNDFFNVVLNIEIIFVTYWRQGYIIIMYRTVKIRKRLFLARKNWQENEYVINIIWKKKSHICKNVMRTRHLLLQDETKITTTLSGLAATVCNKISLPPTCIAISVASS